MPLAYLVVFRTHLWDSDVERAAHRLARCFPGGQFVVAADETRGPLRVADFPTLSHTDDFAADGLPNIPGRRVLWWNADYVLFKTRQAFPDFQYYVMVEFDVYADLDGDALMARVAEDQVALVAHEIRSIADGKHWAYGSIDELTKQAWHALIPIVVLSAALLDALHAARHALAAGVRGARSAQWPYCEVLIPTVAKMQGFKTAEIGNYAATQLLRFRPFISIRDERLQQPGILAHPVLAGRRFVEAFIKHEPRGSHFLSDGSLRAELRRESYDDLAAVLGPFEDLRDAPPSVPAALAFLGDVARDRPATQSSFSRWSRGGSLAADAGSANSGHLAADYAFHTGDQRDAWWQVDLEQVCLVQSVEILNRVRNPNAFVKFRIETSLDGTNWAEAYRKTSGALVSASEHSPALFHLNAPVFCRYLRIMRLGDGVLHLRRVRVLGVAPAAAGDDHVLAACCVMLSALARRNAGEQPGNPMRDAMQVELRSLMERAMACLP